MIKDEYKNIQKMRGILDESEINPGFILIKYLLSPLFEQGSIGKTIPSYNEIFLEFIDNENYDMTRISYVIKKLSLRDRYKDNTIYLNNDLCIKGIYQKIWDYSIGGYQILDEYIKCRVDCESSRRELEHFVSVCCVIKKTIEAQNDNNVDADVIYK